MKLRLSLSTEAEFHRNELTGLAEWLKMQNDIHITCSHVNLADLKQSPVFPCSHCIAEKGQSCDQDEHLCTANSIMSAPQCRLGLSDWFQ